jgi:coenzyme F420 hydrogenase subunit delta
MEERVQAIYTVPYKDHMHRRQIPRSAASSCAVEVKGWVNRNARQQTYWDAVAQLALGLELAGKVVVLGCGNVLRGDDGFGPAVIAYMKSHLELDSDVVAEDVGTAAGMVIIDIRYAADPPQGLVILDAADFGGVAGQLREVEIEDLDASSAGAFGLHGFPPSSLLKEIRDIRGVPIRIISCQPSDEGDDYRMSLSAPVRASVPRAARMALRVARGLSHK